MREARIALGGVATVPWRAKEAEAALRGKAIDERDCQGGRRRGLRRRDGPRATTTSRSSSASARLIRALHAGRGAGDLDMASAAAPQPKANMGEPGPALSTRD